MTGADYVGKDNRRKKMINSIQIDGYRGFAKFEMNELGRINLLVGKNNSGKTSILEALTLLGSPGHPGALWNVLWRRGERFLPIEDVRTPHQQELDICRLFNGHEIHNGSEFTLTASNSPAVSVSFNVETPTPQERQQMLIPAAPVPLPPEFVLHMKSSMPFIGAFPISSNKGIPFQIFWGVLNAQNRGIKPGFVPTIFIPSESLDTTQLVAMWDEISLTPNENIILDALSVLEPDIERIASQSIPQVGPPFQSNRSGFKIKMKTSDQPIPIGSMGDGMWRMLALAITISRCKGGILLIDEIDTGLHYTVMAEMWKLLFSNAKKFNVQVFATTHSYDCVHSLAKLCAGEQDESNHIALHRIEIGKNKSIPYTERQIQLAAERNIEVR